MRGKKLSAGASTRKEEATEVKEWSCVCYLEHFFTTRLPVLAGIVAMLVCGALYAKLIHEQREARYFISGILEVEREISMRTEQGLYYSYYKQIVQSKKSLTEAVMDLTRDNFTEHPFTINVLERMNIYQEVLLAALYRGVDLFRNHFEKFLFYTWAVSALNGLMLACIFALSWILSSTWTAGLLACVLYQLNENDTNRLSHSIALRESFSLPFFWLQLVAFVLLLKLKNESSWFHTTSLVTLFISNFLFALFWQFNQFALLLEVFAVVALSLFGILPKKKVSLFLFSIIVGLLLTATLQFGNPMILSSLCLAAALAGLIVTMALHSLDVSSSSSPGKNVAKVLLKGLSFIAIIVIVNVSARKIFHTTADTHIFHFVKRKLGITQERMFDVRMYECVGAFDWIGWDFIDRLKDHGVFYLYVFAHGFWLLQLIATCVCRLLSRPVGENSLIYLPPEKAALTVISAVLSILAVTTLRMKYFWIPFMCLFSPAALSILTSLVGRLVHALPRISLALIRQGLVLGLFCSAALKVNERVSAELSNLREFWDPDTVELMQWISNSTTPRASFAGSMQLMAGVKLCSVRPIVNHPHFENTELRLRTRELYQMYARKPAHVVHEILKRYEVNYIILEDSICMIPSKGCRLPDIMDEANGEIPDHGEAYSPHLKTSSMPRFCDRIRYSHGTPSDPYSALFTLVLRNPTFRVYKVL